MNEVTRQDLIEWFGEDRDINEKTIEDLKDELDDARMRVFEHFGFGL
jgi:hypothetical protein